MQAPAFKAGTIRDWLFHRDTNMLSSAVVQIDGRIWIDIDRFNIWLSLDKDEVSDFRNLRTKEQILEVGFIKAPQLEHWLRRRHWNGLEEAVIKKGEKRLYIDIHKLNSWLTNQNINPDFGRLKCSE
ncbi:hypothetical protein KFE96_00615 [Kordiimonas sp. SCSIO 12603]|uniref:hypothetical protein n=1 Tax=Kordiimonas sp. SCSIO 12603 TaxID=2829596 RepID=UPI002105EFE7|nr:hypothetical protein [Kordiimonas sp. SCSIO 12603]UTW58845.1 hypothetical protein KFE96_00615 [Kordiimonas sp. SCSIO 12603]